MKTEFDIKKILRRGIIQDELELERALIADRKLRILSKENEEYRKLREKLRDIIEAYENDHWSSASNITDQQLRENDIAELIAEKERVFLQNRKTLIKKELRRLNLTQQEFGVILGHKSKSYISELMNGVSPFTLRDLIVINRLLKIDLKDLVPVFLSEVDRTNIMTSIRALENPKLKLSKEDLNLV